MCFVLGRVHSVLDLIYSEEIFDYELIPDLLLFLTIPLFYVYAHKVSVIKEQTWNYRILLPGVIELVILLVLIVLNIPYYNHIAFDIYSLFGIGFSVYIVLKIIRFANKHLEIVKNQYASISGLHLYWVKQFTTVLLINLIITILTNFLEERVWIELMLISLDLIMVYWIIYQGMQQENVEPLLDEEEEDYIVKQVDSNTPPKLVSEDDKAEMKTIVLTLDNYLIKTKDFKRKDLSIIDVSRAIEVSPKKVSKAINLIKEVNFNGYINAFRIQEAVSYLQSTEFDYLSIEGIGHEAGFKSKSTFYSAFKKEKNCTPSELRNQYLST